MWTIIELIASLAIILVFTTELFWPLIAGRPLFGSFRKLNKEKKTTSSETSLDEKIATAKTKVEEVKMTQDEINKKFKTAEQLKEEADNLLK